MRNLIVIILLFIGVSCDFVNKDLKSDKMDRIIFLHHSTGYNIWRGKTNKYFYKLFGKGDVQKFIESHNSRNHTNYAINELFFPKEIPYGWKNYPFDYYNIWVKNAGEKPYKEEPTLEMLTKEYKIIIFKHCFPVSNILEDIGSPDINSEEKRLENYKLQYNALKNKMLEFADNKFILWTPAVNVKNLMTEDEAIRTKEFHNWIINEWDKKGDNIYVWDFYKFETDGGLYFLDKYSDNPDNSHPTVEFSARLAPLFGKFIIDVAEGVVE